MGTIRTDGETCKPFLIYPYERVPSTLMSIFPHQKATIAATKSGWMNSETFCFFLTALAEEATENGIKFPIILFVDNHASHTTLEASETAKHLNIVMIFLYPNSTFLLQPADVAVFRSLKSLWREENRLARQNEIIITKFNFAQLFLQAYSKMTPVTIRAGFFKTGLFLFDSQNVDYSKCLGKEKASTNQNTGTSIQQASTSATNMEVALQHPFFFEESNPVPNLTSSETLEINQEEYGEVIYNNVRDYDEIFDDQNSFPETNEEETFGQLLEEIEENPSTDNVRKSILKLPPTPQRMGKRQVKRTHPVAEENIDPLRESRVLKAQKEDEKERRKIARIEKKKKTIADKLEKVLKRKEKDLKMIEALTQQHESLF